MLSEEVDDVLEALDLTQDSLRTAFEDVERQVAQRTAELEAASNAKDRLLANMNHELRTPLNSILGYTGVVLQGLAGQLTTEQESQLRMVDRSARHLLELVENALGLADLDAGRLVVSIDEVDLWTVVKDAVAETMPTAQIKGLSIDVGGGSLTLCTDAARVRNIVINLLQNAIKFTSRGSIAVTLDRRNGHACIAVGDTGVGIEPDQLDRVFEEFHQLPSATEAKNRGAGIGLSVSSRIARLLGGELTVASEPGSGSTFTLCLPITRPSAASGHVPRRSVDRKGS
jgi:signal transduction histidine kinase